MLIAGFLFAIMNVCVKQVSHLPTMEVVLFRSIISLAICFVILKKLQIPLFGNNKVLLSIRGIAGCIGLIGSFYTLQNIPLASAVTINYLSPMFTAMLGIFLVKQRLRPIQYLYFVMAIGGVLALKGFDSRISMMDLTIGLTAALSAGLAYNIIARLKTSEHSLVIIFYFPLVTLPIVSIFTILDWHSPSSTDYVYLLSIGLLSQGAQYYMTRSYQQANLGKIASLNYLGVIYAITFGYFFFGEQLNSHSTIGIVLILLAVVLNFLTKPAIQK
ncbi:DMT family transporter [Sphingobacterium sp. JB170]|uniref:DMT family transporter n=1 Tax=Sphingobacterium sp. JB170 TaxID=1434842 RepID=UPI00097F49D6|nr:DMT family transporter [Sphingobacterium sp. JB170]SJN17208.1 Permease of the drug/metabolite transporter (DMT) superfamily [Sphingobacterium sp. JB170]